MSHKNVQHMLHQADRSEERRVRNRRYTLLCPTPHPHPPCTLQWARGPCHHKHGCANTQLDTQSQGLWFFTSHLETSSGSLFLTRGNRLMSREVNLYTLWRSTRPAVANLSDLMNHQWSLNHWLATAVLGCSLKLPFCLKIPFFVWEWQSFAQ